ncbi:MAG: calcium-binding protein, partial [bacterium]
GAGQDIAYDLDATAGNIDAVQLPADVAPGDVTFTRDASHLYLRINGTTDILTLQNWFESDASKIEEIRFADGTIWDLPAILARLPVATEAADTLYGLTSADSITGLGGNDTVYALGGNDIVDGGAGNDRLEGGNGDDALAGGAGDDMLIGGEGTDLLHGESANDTLDGGAGNDIYRFGRGSGLDTVRDADSTAGNVDVIRLDADILPPDVRVSRDQWNLYLTINGTDDKLILEDWFQDDASKVEHVEFADGTVWDVAALLTKASTPTEDSDYLAGTSSADTLLGLGGDDQLYGDAGNDILGGGAGTDTLYGGSGNDVYLFGRGDGQDLIYDYDATPGNIDTVRLTSWSLTNALLDFHLGGSDTEALGGDLAYQYGKTGTLAGLGVTPVQSVLGHAQFGTTPQALQPLATLQEGLAKLG